MIKNSLDTFIQYLSDKQDILNECRDHFGRTLVHFSVEHDNLLFAQCILPAGFNPNVVEYCGATPLTLSVCLNLPWFCEFLVKCGCEVRGSVFVGIPSPLEMARKLENAQIYEILNPDELDSEDADPRSYEKKIRMKIRPALAQRESIIKTLVSVDQQLDFLLGLLVMQVPAKLIIH